MLDSKATIKGVPIKEIYIDQGMISTGCSGYSFFCALTPYGVQKLESKYAQRIQALNRGESYTEYSWNYSEKPPKREIENVFTDTFNSLLKEIHKDKHLHKLIKENLIYNLKMYQKAK